MVNNRHRVFVLLALFLIAEAGIPTARASPTAIGIDCNALFTPGGVVNGGYGFVTSSFASFPNPVSLGLVDISVVIILMVLTVYAVAYMAGMAFGIDRLKQLTRNEILESVVNLIILAVIVGGIGVFNAAMGFLTGLSGTLVGSSASVSSPQLLYTNICNSYITGVIYPDIEAGVYNLVQTVLYSALQTLNVDLMPNGFGATFSPFSGIYPVIQVLYTEFGVLLAIIGIALSVIIFLYIIFFLFPIFLYAGIALRSFPWTRPAGGSLMALFISFYVVFPAVLYPFVYYGSTLAQPQQCTIPGTNGEIQCPPSIITSLTNDATAIYNIISVTAAGGILEDSVVQFGQNVSVAAIDAIGFVIAFIVSYDLLERLGDILGSPALAGGRHQSVLSKII